MQVPTMFDLLDEHCWKFITGLESLIIFLVVIHYLFPPHTLILALLMISLLIGICYSFFQLFFGKWSLSAVGAIGGFFVITGIATAVLQLEISYWQGYIHPVNAAFILSSLGAVAAGIMITRIKAGDITHDTTVLLFWCISLLLLLYIPLSPFVIAASEGEITFVGMGITMSILSSTYFVARQRRGENIDELLEQGNLRRLLGDIEGAEIRYRQALRSNPSNEKVLTFLGDLYFDSDRCSQALSSYIRCLEFNDGRNLRRAALSSLLLGQNAVKLMKKAVKSNPSPDNWFVLGAAYGNIGEKEKERSCYQKALSIDSEHWLSIYGISKIDKDISLKVEALITGDYSPEKRHILISMGGSNEFVDLFLHPAELKLREEGKVEPALQRFMLGELLSSIEIDDPDIWESSQNFLEDYPDCQVPSAVGSGEEALLVSGILKAACGSYEAVNDLKKVDEDDRAKYALAVVQTLRKNYRDALAVLKSISKPRLAPKAYALIGSIHYRIGRGNDALAAYQKAKLLGYQRSEIEETINTLRAEMEMWPIRLYQSPSDIPLSLLVEKHPSEADIIEYAARGIYDVTFESLGVKEKTAGLIRFLGGDLKNALNLFESGLEKNQEDPDVLLGMALCELVRENTEKSLSYFNQAVELGEKDPLYLFYRGKALYQLGRNGEALQDFKTVYFSRPGWSKNIYYIKKCGSDVF